MSIRLPSTWVRVGDDGGSVTFHFCPACAATVHYDVEGDDADAVAIAAAAFADPGFPAPRFLVSDERMH